MVNLVEADSSYAIAAGAVTAPSSAAPAVLSAAVDGLARSAFARSWALPVTLGLLVVALDALASQQKKGAARFTAWMGASLAGVAASAALVSGLFFWSGRNPLTQALVLALTLALVHYNQRRHRAAGRGDAAAGGVAGRDTLLVVLGVLFATAFVSAPAGGRNLDLDLVALGVAVAVCAYAAWVEKTARHVYFIEVAVMGAYALLRNIVLPQAPPEMDAVLALLLGFVLVGVTVMAQRSGVPPVAQATRRFAAVLPIVVAILLPDGTSRSAAAMAALSSALYMSLAAVARSRWFGFLAAAAANLALLIGMLAEGLTGVEIYLAPLGLLLIMLGQLVAANLPQASRNALRVLGGLLLYAPAAIKIGFQVGQGAEGIYSLIFGAVCLGGIIAGMLLHVRAFLVLGTLFITLDVVANLLQAGLRDRRVGFVVLTLAGLTILGGMVLFTLKREQMRDMASRVRRTMVGWE